MELVTAIFLVMGGALALLFKQNRKLKSEKKLHDIAVEDARLKERQDAVAHNKESVKRNMENLKKDTARDMSDSEIEDFWNKENKK